MFYLIVATEEMDGHIERCAVIPCCITDENKIRIGPKYRIRERQTIYDVIEDRDDILLPPNYFTCNLNDEEKPLAQVKHYNGHGDYITTESDKKRCNNLKALVCDDPDKFKKTYNDRIVRKEHREAIVSIVNRNIARLRIDLFD